jgi:hypothetical protein
VGPIGGAGTWRFYNGSGTTDVALSTDPYTLGDLKLSMSTRAGRYSENNPSAANPYRALIGDDIEYDWNIQDNAAPASTTYCFRMTKSDGSALSAYTYYPEITTSGYRPKSQNWHFYADATSTTPTVSMAPENNAPSNVPFDSTFKLRMTLKDTANAAGSNVKFRLQFSTQSDFSSDLHWVEATSSCQDGTSLWCYGNSSGTDNGTIVSKVMSDSDACSGGVGNGCGTYNTTPTSTSSFSSVANAATEFEFTLRHAGAKANTVYYFRAVDAALEIPVPPNTGENYPSVATEGAQLSFSIAGLPSGTDTQGIVTAATTTATSSAFGTLAINTSPSIAQRLTVSTNATQGYQVTLQEDGPMTNISGNTINDVASPNSAPLPWVSACVSSSTSCLGYHTGDSVLSGATPARFAATDSFAAFSTSSDEVIYNGGPINNEVTDMVYRLQIGNQQIAGNYQNKLVYIITAIY